MAAQISRRGFVSAAAGVTGIAVMVPDALAFKLQGRLTPTYSGGTFPDGIASGDPTPTGITLWTRLFGVTGNGSVLLEIATDSKFKKVVKSSLVPADPTKQFVVKTRIEGLKAHTQYYYRFATKTKNSTVGRFRTALPADSTQTVNFAYFTCQDYTAGYFNAHALMAKDDVDFVINLGDFIYETAFFDATKGMVRPGGFFGRTALSGPVTYDEYCNRYQGYRKDADLQAMAANHAMISTWDDHEVMNNYAGADITNSGGGGDSKRSNPPLYTGWSDARKLAGYQAWFDNMPTFPQSSGGYKLYHKAKFGKNLELFVLDERQYRDAQPCGFNPADKEIDPATCTNLNTNRAFLGQEQMSFLTGGLASSTSKWKVLANEVVAMPLRQANGNIESADDWTAYPLEREQLLGAIKNGGIKNVVFATGDYHTFFAGQVKDSSDTPVATEFAAGSVTQLSTAEIAALLGTPGFGTPSNVTLPVGSRESDYLSRNPHLKEFDQLHHGYVLASASATQFTATFKKLQTVKAKSTTLASSKKYTVAANSTTIA